MSNIEWGEPIEVNGVKPDWLRDGDVIVYQIKTHTEYWYGTPFCGYTAKAWGNWGSCNWEVIAFIKLPADHPYYLAVSKGYKYWPGGDAAPADLKKGTKALLRDGRQTANDADWYVFDWECHGSSVDIIGYIPDDTPATQSPEVPDWAIQTAIERCGGAYESGEAWTIGQIRERSSAGAPYARCVMLLAQYIAESEQAPAEPVDPDLLIARKIVADDNLSRGNKGSAEWISNGDWDNNPSVILIIKGIKEARRQWEADNV